MLQLESESGGTISDPTNGDISQALSQLDGEGNNFAILKRSDTDYIQAAGNAKQELTVEYHDPATDDHFSAGGAVPLRTAVELFQDFRLNGTKWKSMVPWRGMEIASSGKRGCAAMIAFACLLGGAAISAIKFTG
jgi:hypothetical protein